MATNNSIDSLDPIQVALGGTGTSTLTANGVLYGNGTAAVGVTSVGTASQVLTSNGAGVAPTFQNLSGGTGSWIFLQTQTASNSASIAFTGITSAYNTYIVIWSQVIAATNAVQHQLLFSTNGGSSYLSSGYSSTCVYYNTASAPGYNTSTSFIPLTLSGGMLTGFPTCGTMFLYQLGVSGNPQVTANISISSSSTSGVSTSVLSGGYGSSSITTNAIAFQMSSGNITSGTYSLYGLN